MALTETFLLEHYVELGKSARMIAKECGISHPTVRKQLREFSIPIRRGGDCVPIADIVGKTFNKWTVIAYAGLSKCNQRQFQCECECGALQLLVQSRFITGKTRNCRACGYRSGMAHGLRKGYKEITGHFWTKCRHSAQKRKHDFLITIGYAYLLLVEQAWKCKLSGLPLYIAQHHTEASTASLDRIDSSQGYIEGNVQWVHKDVNLMKNKLVQQRFVELCVHIAEVSGAKISV